MGLDKNTAAVLHGARDLRIEQRTLDAAPAPGYARVRIMSTTLCGSDRMGYLFYKMLANTLQSTITRTAGMGHLHFVTQCVWDTSRAGSSPPLLRQHRHLWLLEPAWPSNVGSRATAQHAPIAKQVATTCAQPSASSPQQRRHRISTAHSNPPSTTHSHSYILSHHQCHTNWAHSLNPWE